jgi:hypothetical protein
MLKKTIIKKLSFCLLFSFLVMNSENFSYKFNVPFFNSQIFYCVNDVKKINKKNDQLALMSGLQTGELKYEVLEMVYEVLNKVYKEQGLKGEKLDEAIQKFYKYLGKGSEIKIDTNEYFIDTNTDQLVRIIKIEYNGKQYEHKIVIDRESSKVSILRGELYPRQGLMLNGIYFSPEMFKLIFENLPVTSLVACMKVCKTWLYLSGANSIWKRKCVEWCKKQGLNETYLNEAIKVFNDDWLGLYKVLSKMPVTKEKYGKLIQNVKCLLDVNKDNLENIVSAILFDDNKNWKDIIYILAYIHMKTNDVLLSDRIKQYIVQVINDIKDTEHKKDFFELLNVVMLLISNSSDSSDVNFFKLTNCTDVANTKNKELAVNALVAMLLTDNLIKEFKASESEVKDIMILALGIIIKNSKNPTIYKSAIVKLEELLNILDTDEWKRTIIDQLIIIANSSDSSLEAVQIVVSKLKEMFLDNFDNIFNAMKAYYKSGMIYALGAIAANESNPEIRNIAIVKLKGLYKIVQENDLKKNIINAFGYIVSSRNTEIRQLGIKELENIFKENFLKDEIICVYMRIIQTNENIPEIRQLAIKELDNLLKIIDRYDFPLDKMEDIARKQDIDQKTYYSYLHKKVDEIRLSKYMEKYRSLRISKHVKDKRNNLQQIWIDIEKLAKLKEQNLVDCMNNYFPWLVDYLHNMQIDLDVIAQSEDINSDFFNLYKEQIEAQKILYLSKEKIKYEKLIMLSDGMVIYCITTENGKEIKKILAKPVGYTMPINDFRRINCFISNTLREMFSGKVNVNFFLKIQDLIFKTLSKQNYMELLNGQGIRNIVAAS